MANKYTLADMKKAVYKLIEDITLNDDVTLTDDPDLARKFNSVANSIMYECFNIRKKPEEDEVEAVKDEEFVLTDEYPRFYLLKRITGVKYRQIDNIIIWQEDGTAKVYYYNFPKRINEDVSSDDEAEYNASYVFDLDPNVIEAMKYGIAGDILKESISQEYGELYMNRYRELLNKLDNRFTQGNIDIVGGVDI